MSTKRFIGLLAAALLLVGILGALFWESGFNAPKSAPIPTFFYENKAADTPSAQDRLPN